MKLLLCMWAATVHTNLKEGWKTVVKDSRIPTLPHVEKTLSWYPPSPPNMFTQDFAQPLGGIEGIFMGVLCMKPYKVEGFCSAINSILPTAVQYFPLASTKLLC